MIRVAQLLALALVVLTGCSTSPLADRERDRGPAVHRPELATLPDPVVRDEPRSRYGNHSPYVVFGKTYRVMDTVRDYEVTGTASWYGEKFQGRPTSSGEPYDMFALTAAHRSLPLPSYLRVTNLANGRATIVRVNDRGPFHSDRVIDLSYAAAVKLGFVDDGTARVKLELVTAAPTAPALPRYVATAPVPAEPAPTDPALAAPAELFLQAGAFSRRQGAEQLHADLTALVGAGVHIDHNGDDALFRVRIGPIEHMGEATRLQALIATSQLGMPLIIRESQ
jgi:rare lipoprotein A